MAAKLIDWTPAKLARLRVAYKTAYEEQKDVFVFEGNKYSTKYVFYLIEYLTGAVK